MKIIDNGPCNDDPSKHNVTWIFDQRNKHDRQTLHLINKARTITGLSGGEVIEESFHLLYEKLKKDVELFKQVKKDLN
jgi:hypothetical protein